MPIGMVNNSGNNNRGRRSSSPDSSSGEDSNRSSTQQQHGTAQRRQPQQQQQQEDLYDDSIPDDYGEIDAKQSNGKMKIAIAVVIAVVVIGALAFVKLRTPKTDVLDDADAVIEEGEESGGNSTFAADDNSTDEKFEEGAVYNENGDMIYNEDGEVVDKDAIDPGAPNYESEQSETTATVYNESDFIKDLNGINVSAVYNVASRDYVYDYVNYTAKRAIMDEGMELYWLDVVYNNKKYRIQVPFYRFKDLKANGICKVQVEVLTLDGGGKIISWMQVVDDSAGVE